MSRENRRRIDPAVGRERRRRWLARLVKGGLIGGTTVATVAGLWWLNEAMRINSWDIEGPETLQTAVDLELSHEKDRLDLIHAWPARLRSELMQAIPDLADIRIARQLPDHLQLTVVARHPVALWQNDHNVWLVDGHGQPYRKLKAGESPDLPLFRVAEADLATSVQLLASLQAGNAKKVAQLSELRADEESWQLYFEHGELWMLSKSDAGSEIARLTHILNNPRWKNGTWRIDARASSRWYLRPAPQGGVI